MIYICGMGKWNENVSFGLLASGLQISANSVKAQHFCRVVNRVYKNCFILFFFLRKTVKMLIYTCGSFNLQLIKNITCWVFNARIKIQNSLNLIELFLNLKYISVNRLVTSQHQPCLDKH